MIATTLDASNFTCSHISLKCIQCIEDKQNCAKCNVSAIHLKNEFMQKRPKNENARNYLKRTNVITKYTS